MTKNLPYLPTIGAIADRVGAPEKAVSKIIQAKGIRPVARAGIAYVYSLESVEEIRQEVQDREGAAS